MDTSFPGKILLRLEEMGIDPVRLWPSLSTLSAASATNPSRLEGGLTQELACGSLAIALSGSGSVGETVHLSQCQRPGGSSPGVTGINSTWPCLMHNF